MSQGAIATSPRLSKKTDSALFSIFMLRSLLDLLAKVHFALLGEKGKG
ncbi:hypothetical protein [Nostoc sp. ChiSLP03a]|nr:hypothetical protein [Nostoc sp. ChiSLP03a]MDZ8215177.1 hypothetical protein [Nostoc sp. ChiSLP03a]